MGIIQSSARQPEQEINCWDQITKHYLEGLIVEYTEAITGYKKFDKLWPEVKNENSIHILYKLNQADILRAPDMESEFFGELFAHVLNKLNTEKSKLEILGNIVAHYREHSYQIKIKNISIRDREVLITALTKPAQYLKEVSKKSISAEDLKFCSEKLYELKMLGADDLSESFNSENYKEFNDEIHGFLKKLKGIDTAEFTNEEKNTYSFMTRIIKEIINRFSKVMICVDQAQKLISSEYKNMMVQFDVDLEIELDELEYQILTRAEAAEIYYRERFAASMVGQAEFTEMYSKYKTELLRGKTILINPFDSKVTGEFLSYAPTDQEIQKIWLKLNHCEIKLGEGAENDHDLRLNVRRDLIYSLLAIPRTEEGETRKITEGKNLYLSIKVSDTDPSCCISLVRKTDGVFAQ